MQGGKVFRWKNSRDKYINTECGRRKLKPLRGFVGIFYFSLMRIFLPFRPFIKIYLSFLGFFVVLLSGTVGYMAIEGYGFLNALYMTVITLSTVGFHEVHPLSEAGQIFTIILIIVNIGTFTYFITQISQYFLDGEFSRTFKLLNMKEQIQKLSGHVILCGYGRNGHEAAQIFSQRNKEFVVIEKDEEHKHDGQPVPKYFLHGDATHDELLREAGIEKASAIIASLPDDAANLFIVLTARELNPLIKIICRASKDSSVKKFKTAGANNVIMPDKIGGAHMAALVMSPDVKEFIDILATQNTEHFQIEELTAAKTVSLEELDCWRVSGATVLGIKTSESEYVINPASKHVIRPGNKIIAMGSRQQLQKLSEIIS